MSTIRTTEKNCEKSILKMLEIKKTEANWSKNMTFIDPWSKNNYSLYKSVLSQQ